MGTNIIYVIILILITYSLATTVAFSVITKAFIILVRDYLIMQETSIIKNTKVEWMLHTIEEESNIELYVKCRNINKYDLKEEKGYKESFDIINNYDNKQLLKIGFEYVAKRLKI